ncbi:MAG: hypothetical protein WC878_06495 [Candidatus Paceibacterota bacterium]|jgi:hypothetical protein
MKWLSTEICGRKNLVLAILFVTVAQYFYTAGMSDIFHFLGIKLSPVAGKEYSIYAFSFPFIILWIVFWEEVKYRLPVALLLELKLPHWMMFPMIFSLQLYFGSLHGGMSHFFFQGAGGIAYCILFLKCGGMQRRYAKALGSVTAAHFAWDMLLASICAHYGATTF